MWLRRKFQGSFLAFFLPTFDHTGLPIFPGLLVWLLTLSSALSFSTRAVRLYQPQLWRKLPAVTMLVPVFAGCLLDTHRHFSIWVVSHSHTPETPWHILWGQQLSYLCRSTARLHAGVWLLSLGYICHGQGPWHTSQEHRPLTHPSECFGTPIPLCLEVTVTL